MLKKLYPFCLLRKKFDLRNDLVEILDMRHEPGVSKFRFPLPKR